MRRLWVIAGKLSAFVGQKIATGTNELMAKVKKVLPQLPCSVPFQAYYYVNKYSIYLSVRVYYA
jgi:hypothetical protein